MERAWSEAEHHLEVARRLGEDVPRRDAIFEQPALDGERDRGLPPARSCGDEPADLQFGFFPPERIDRDLNRLRSLLAGSPPTIILCDNEGQLERLDELLRRGRPPARPRDARDRRAGRRLRDAARSGCSPTTRSSAASAASGARGATARRRRRPRPARSSRRLRGASRARRRHLPRHRDDLRRARAPSKSRSSSTRAATGSTCRSTGSTSSSATAPRATTAIARRRACTGSAARAGSSSASARAQAIQEMTVELLDLYARRKVATGSPSRPDTPWQRQLESSFLFEDTPDQRKATDEVKRDMEQPRPMDRLLVGDVGYGKTEIAVRAAFKAVQCGKQVAVLVPDDDSRRPARAHLQRAARRLPGARSRCSAASRRAEGAEGRARRARAKARSTSSSARIACSVPT